MVNVSLSTGSWLVGSARCTVDRLTVQPSSSSAATTTIVRSFHRLN